MEQSRLSAIQFTLDLHGFDLSEEKMAFAEEFLVNGGDGGAAMQKIRPHLNKNSAKVRAHDWLGKRRNDGKPGREGDPELLRYIDARRMQVRRRAQITEDELAEKFRRVYEHSVGDAPLRKTLLEPTFTEEGKRDGVEVSERLVYEPNLPSANAATEGLRRLAGFGKDLLGGGQDGPVLSQAERAARLASLMERMRRDREGDDRAA